MLLLRGGTPAHHPLQSAEFALFRRSTSARLLRAVKGSQPAPPPEQGEERLHPGRQVAVGDRPKPRRNRRDEIDEPHDSALRSALARESVSRTLSSVRPPLRRARMAATPRKAEYVIAVLRSVPGARRQSGMDRRQPGKQARSGGIGAASAGMVGRGRNGVPLLRPSRPPARLHAGGLLGAARGDLLRMTWAQYSGHRILLRQAKGKKLLEVPRHEDLDATPRRSPLMLTAFTWFRRAWRRAVEAAGHKGLQVPRPPPDGSCEARGGWLYGPGNRLYLGSRNRDNDPNSRKLFAAELHHGKGRDPQT